MIRSLLIISLFLHPPVERPYRHLTYGDFRGRGPQAGHLLTGIRLNWDQADSVFTPSVESYFIPDSSYLTIKTPWVLAHEQGHMDICEIYTRRLRARLPKHCGPAAKDRIDALYQQTLDAWCAEEDRYDAETNHSEIKEAQQAWSAKIAAELH